MKQYFMDMFFYHIKLKCYVVVVNKPLGVASYELNIKTDDFKNNLPTIEEIESEIK